MIQQLYNGAGVVILDEKKYNNKLPYLISEPSKFVACHSKPTETVGKKINNIGGKYKGKYKAETAAQSDNDYLAK